MPTDMDERRQMAELIATKIAVELRETLDFMKMHGWGVTIFAFDFMEPDAKSKGAIAYLSTAERADMINAMKEWLAYQEAGLTTDPPGDRSRA